jgi:hypothetical protein
VAAVPSGLPLYQFKFEKLIITTDTALFSDRYLELRFLTSPSFKLKKDISSASAKVENFDPYNYYFSIVKNNRKYKKGLGSAHPALCSTVL